jgi:transcriptional regulator with XRE-family HTH domain
MPSRCDYNIKNRTSGRVTDRTPLQGDNLALQRDRLQIRLPPGSTEQYRSDGQGVHARSLVLADGAIANSGAGCPSRMLIALAFGMRSMQVRSVAAVRDEGALSCNKAVLSCRHAMWDTCGQRRTVTDSGDGMKDELFTSDLDITSAPSRSHLAALLRTIHLRADRPSLRTLEARTRHDSTPLSKTVVSEMLKGARFPRKAVMISFLRACGVPEDRMEPWRRTWERIAADEQDLSRSESRSLLARQDQLATGGMHATRSVAGGQAGGEEIPTTLTDGLGGAPSTASAGLGEAEPQDLASNPTLRRRELGFLLRQLRIDRGLNIDEVGERAMFSATKLSRLETGRVGASPRDIRDLCIAYGITDATERERLMALAREGKQRAWWQQFDLPYATYVGLEAEATSISDYNPDIIPGLLQVESYARAIFESGDPPLDPSSLEGRIEARIRRQALLARADAPLFHAIVDEGALRRVIGGRVVMRAQLARITEVVSLPNVTFQVIPFEAGAHPGLDSNFVILENARSAVNDVVYVEGAVGNIYVETDAELERYKRIFSRLQSIALDSEGSVAMVARIAASYENSESAESKERHGDSLHSLLPEKSSVENK